MGLRRLGGGCHIRCAVAVAPHGPAAHAKRSRGRTATGPAPAREGGDRTHEPGTAQVCDAMQLPRSLGDARHALRHACASCPAEMTVHGDSHVSRTTRTTRRSRRGAPDTSHRGDAPRAAAATFPEALVCRARRHTQEQGPLQGWEETGAQRGVVTHGAQAVCLDATAPSGLNTGTGRTNDTAGDSSNVDHRGGRPRKQKSVVIHPAGAGADFQTPHNSAFIPRRAPPGHGSRLRHPWRRATPRLALPALLRVRPPATQTAHRRRDY